MKLFSVFAPPGIAAGQTPLPASAAERLAFVKDGFAWPALFFPVLWILWHRLWLTLVWYVVAVLLVAWIGRLAGEATATLVAVLGGILFAWEANNIRRWSFARRGWRELGAACGSDLEEAEVRFFGGMGGSHAPSVPERRETDGTLAPTPVRPGAPRRVEDDGPVLGLFAEPGA